MQEDNEHNEYAIEDEQQRYQKGEHTCIKRDFKDKLIFLYVWQNLNVYRQVCQYVTVGIDMRKIARIFGTSKHTLNYTLT